MKKLVITVAVNILSLWIINYFFTGIVISSGEDLLMLAIVFSALNATIKPILFFLTLPVTIFTFGIFAILLNAFILEMSFSLVRNVLIDSYSTTVLAAIVVSVVNGLLNDLMR